MSVPPINHRRTGKSRIATQYREAKKFLGIVDRVLTITQDIENQAMKMYDIADIDKSQGVILDNIGEIIGISRTIPDGIPLAFFGFEDNPAALPYGEEGVPNIGGRLYEEGEPYLATTSLGDPEYRLIIRAKIAKNHAIGTVEDVIAGIVYMLGIPGDSITPHALENGEVPGGPQVVAVDDIGGMTLNIGIGRPLTFLEKTLISQLDLLPRPAGVQILIKSNYPSDGYFGFFGMPGAKGFGEVGDPSIGGIFAEKF